MVSSALDHNKPRVLVSGLSNGLGGTEIVVGRYIKALAHMLRLNFLLRLRDLVLPQLRPSLTDYLMSVHLAFQMRLIFLINF